MPVASSSIAPPDLGSARRSASARVLHDLATSGQVAVRLAVAGNPHAGDATLRLLVQDEVAAISFTAGLHLLERLVESPAALEVATVLWADGWTIPVENGDLSRLAWVANELAR